MLPLPHFLEQSEDVLGLCAFVAVEGLAVGIVLIGEGDDVVLDLLLHVRVDIEGYLELTVLRSALVLLRAQVGYLQLYLAEFRNHVVEAIAEDRVAFVLVNLEVQFFEELVLPLDELLLANAEENGYLGSQPPELFVLDDSCALGIVLLPETQAILEVEDVD